MTEKNMREFCSARRKQSLIDIFVSVFLGMLVWPFPIARALLTPGVHVAGVLAACVVMQPLYFSVCALAWSQTLGMRLMGLRVERGADTSARAVMWGAVTGALALWYAVAPKSACEAGIPERLSSIDMTMSEMER